MSASQNLFINQINIYISYLKADSNTLIISAGNKMLRVYGKDENSPLRIGGLDSNVDITHSLIKVTGKTCIDLKFVILEYATLKGKNKYGVGLNVDFSGLEPITNDNTGYSNIKIDDNSFIFSDSLLLSEGACGNYMMLTFDNIQIIALDDGKYSIKKKVEILSGINEKYYTTTNKVYYQFTNTIDAHLVLYFDIPAPINYFFVNVEDGLYITSESYSNLIGCSNINAAILKINNDSCIVRLIKDSLIESLSNTLSYSTSIKKDESLSSSEVTINVQTGSNILFIL